ncbi:MAG: hypothetical protein LQ340_006258 [Diploschistes diacapsis]|nr:MAG: hypothetical protein LQ340_006258 [Diploschistes diacapsis]
MIIRGTRQKLRRDVARGLRPLFDQLQCPWLCPALNNDFSGRQRIRRTATSVERRPSPVPPSVTAANRPPDRGFAYAATQEPVYQDDYIPWEANTSLDGEHQHKFSWTSEKSASNLPHFDPSTPLIIPNTLQLAPRTFRHIDGIGGEVGDIHRILQACLQLGQLDRASATVRRLNDIYKADSVELLEAHNAYFAGIIAKIVISNDQLLLAHMHKWFEVEIRGKGIHPNEVTIALMIQASFHDYNEKKTARTIRRYLAIARDYEIYDAVLAAIYARLSDAQFMQLTRYDEEGLARERELILEDEVALPLGDSGTAETEDMQAPTIMPQRQKGLGLTALQKSLALFYNGQKGAKQQMVQRAISGDIDIVELQRQLEKDTIASALERWRTDHDETVKRIGVHSSLQSKSIGSLMWTWHEQLLPAVKDELREIKKSADSAGRDKDVDRLMYGPFLQYISPEKLSATTILVSLQALTRSSSQKGIALARLITEVGKAIEEESEAEMLQRKMKEITKKKISSRQRSKVLAQLIKKKQNNAASEAARAKSSVSRQSRPRNTMPTTPEWSSTIVTKVGAAMVSLLYKVAKIDLPAKDHKNGKTESKSEPAFRRFTQFSHGRRLGVFGMHKVLAEKIMKEPVGSAIAKHLPMLVEPVPWTGYKEGGFLQQPVAVVRTTSSHSETRDYMKLASKSGDMAQVYSALDVLGKTPWKINRAIFNIMAQVWNSGEGVAEIAPVDPKLEYPPDPGPSADKDARLQYAYKVKQLDNLKDGYHSNRCFQNFQLEVARAFLNEQFYFPHNMDFRGRAYPIPPYLNHMGADHCRGLLLFGKGRELGHNGLTWLRVHLANVFGFDKASLIERRDFTYEHVEEINDSARNPLNGRRWWLKAEDPWQCLATCIELTNALDSPDPTKFISHLPVHQDGTCNGLQHYAALGGDSIGAKQVNLEPGDRPSDIYTAVAEMVQQRITEDAMSGDPMGLLLDGKIKRKIVKQTVMTNVYGVTFAGAKMQVLRQLEDFYPDLFADDSRKLFMASSYIAKKIFQSLSIMFTGAHDIQYWLGECASRICDALTPQQIQYIEESAAGKKQSTPFSASPTNYKALEDEHSRFKTSVIWTTPLKMPIVQPYRKGSTKQIKTNFQKINLIEPSTADPVSKRKQLQAFPPNFIHSLDATHMFLSALKCNELGLSFAAVHDSFWTHAADIDTMNLVIRDAFIKMHSENIVGRVAAEFEARYKGGMYLATVKYNSAVGQKIRDLRKKTRQAKKPEAQIKMDELLVERKRLNLLASSNAEERAKGEAMVTPSKLVEEIANKEDVASLEELDGALGEVQNEDDVQATDAVETTCNALDTHEVPDGSSDTDTIPDFISSVVTEGPESAKVATATAVHKAKRAKLARESKKVWVWRPLTFPPVPNKGTFDVSRLKDSKYFFS